MRGSHRKIPTVFSHGAIGLFYRRNLLSNRKCEDAESKYEKKNVFTSVYIWFNKTKKL